MASSDQSSYNSALIQIQKLANTSAEKIQKMVNDSNSAQMAFNKTEAKTARDWQEKMSKSAHQMEVADLKKAGLNPVLSANSGAQSYTTSSASTDNDSGASAASNILGSQLGALSSMESSRLTAEAQKKAAATNAAAIKRAAQTSAAAQRYAASANYAAAKYRADVDLQRTKYKADTEYKIAMDKPAGSLSALIDKHTKKLGIQDTIGKIMNKAANTYKSTLQWVVKNPSKYFSNTSGKVTKDNFKLNSKGISTFNKMTKACGLDVNKANRRLVVKAFVYQDSGSLQLLAKRMDAARKAKLAQRAASAHHGSITPVTRSTTGHR